MRILKRQANKLAILLLTLGAGASLAQAQNGCSLASAGVQQAVQLPTGQVITWTLNNGPCNEARANFSTERLADNGQWVAINYDASARQGDSYGNGWTIGAIQTPGRYRHIVWLSGTGVSPNSQSQTTGSYLVPGPDVTPTCTTQPSAVLPPGSTLTANSTYSWSIFGCPNMTYSFTAAGVAVTGGSSSGNLSASGTANGSFTPTTTGTLTVVTSVNGTQLPARTYNVLPAPCTIQPTASLPPQGTILTVNSPFAWSLSGCPAASFAYSATGVSVVGGSSSGTLSVGGTVAGTTTPTGAGTMTVFASVGGTQVALRSYTVQAAPCTLTPTVNFPSGPIVAGQSYSQSVSGGCAGAQVSISFTGVGATGGGNFNLPFNGAFAANGPGTLGVLITSGGNVLLSTNVAVVSPGCQPGTNGFMASLSGGPYYSGNAIGIFLSGCSGTDFVISTSGVPVTGAGPNTLGGNQGQTGTYSGSLTATGTGSLTVFVHVNGVQVWTQTVQITTAPPQVMPPSIELFTLVDNYVINPGSARYIANVSAPGGSTFGIELLQQGQVRQDIAVAQGQTSFALPTATNVGRYDTAYRVNAPGFNPVRRTDGLLDVSTTFTLLNPPDPSTMIASLRSGQDLLLNVGWSIVPTTNVRIYADLDRQVGPGRENVYETDIARLSDRLSTSGLTPGTYLLRLVFDFGNGIKIPTKDATFRVVGDDDGGTVNSACQFTDRFTERFSVPHTNPLDVPRSFFVNPFGGILETVNAATYYATIFKPGGGEVAKDFNEAALEGMALVYLRNFSPSNSSAWLDTPLTEEGKQQYLAFVRTPTCGWTAHAGAFLVKGDPAVRPEPSKETFVIKIVQASTRRDGRVLVSMEKDGKPYLGVGGVFASYNDSDVLFFKSEGAGLYSAIWPDRTTFTLVGWAKEGGPWSQAIQIAVTGR